MSRYNVPDRIKPSTLVFAILLALEETWYSYRFPFILLALILSYVWPEQSTASDMQLCDAFNIAYDDEKSDELERLCLAFTSDKDSILKNKLLALIKKKDQVLSSSDLSNIFISIYKACVRLRIDIIYTEDSLIVLQKLIENSEEERENLEVFYANVVRVIGLSSERYPLFKRALFWALENFSKPLGHYQLYQKGLNQLGEEGRHTAQEGGDSLEKEIQAHLSKYEEPGFNLNLKDFLWDRFAWRLVRSLDYGLYEAWSADSLGKYITLYAFWFHASASVKKEIQRSVGDSEDYFNRLLPASAELRPLLLPFGSNCSEPEEVQSLVDRYLTRSDERISVIYDHYLSDKKKDRFRWIALSHAMGQETEKGITSLFDWLLGDGIEIIVLKKSEFIRDEKASDANDISLLEIALKNSRTVIINMLINKIRNHFSDQVEEKGNDSESLTKSYVLIVALFERIVSGLEDVDENIRPGCIAICQDILAIVGERQRTIIYTAPLDFSQDSICQLVARYIDTQIGYDLIKQLFDMYALSENTLGSLRKIVLETVNQSYSVQTSAQCEALLELVIIERALSSENIITFLISSLDLKRECLLDKGLSLLKIVATTPSQQTKYKWFHKIFVAILDASKEKTINERLPYIEACRRINEICWIPQSEVNQPPRCSPYDHSWLGEYNFFQWGALALYPKQEGHYIHSTPDLCPFFEDMTFYKHTLAEAWFDGFNSYYYSNEIQPPDNLYELIDEIFYIVSSVKAMQGIVFTDQVEMLKQHSYGIQQQVQLTANLLQYILKRALPALCDLEFLDHPLCADRGIRYSSQDVLMQYFRMGINVYGKFNSRYREAGQSFLNIQSELADYNWQEPEANRLRRTLDSCMVDPVLEFFPKLAEVARSRNPLNKSLYLVGVPPLYLVGLPRLLLANLFSRCIRINTHVHVIVDDGVPFDEDIQRVESEVEIKEGEDTVYVSLAPTHISDPSLAESGVCDEKKEDGGFSGAAGTAEAVSASAPAISALDVRLSERIHLAQESPTTLCAPLSLTLYEGQALFFRYLHVIIDKINQIDGKNYLTRLVSDLHNYLTLEDWASFMGALYNYCYPPGFSHIRSSKLFSSHSGSYSMSESKIRLVSGCVVRNALKEELNKWLGVNSSRNLISLQLILKELSLAAFQCEVTALEVKQLEALVPSAPPKLLDGASGVEPATAGVYGAPPPPPSYNPDASHSDAEKPLAGEETTTTASPVPEDSSFSSSASSSPVLAASASVPVASTSLLAVTATTADTAAQTATAIPEAYAASDLASRDSPAPSAPPLATAVTVSSVFSETSAGDASVEDKKAFK